MSMRRLATPRPATVRSDDRGLPVAIGGSRVESIGEEWVVEDRWWTGKPVRRRYFEAILDDGRCAVVFRDLIEHGWYSQRA